MKVIAIIALLVAVASANPMRQSFSKSVGDIWSDCSQSTDPAKIGTVTISPDPPKSDSDITVTASFAINENVTGGTVTIKVKYSIITVLDQTEDLCTLAKTAGLDCPIKEGTQSLSSTAKFPSAPSGHYTGSVLAKDQSGVELFCANLDFRL